MFSIICCNFAKEINAYPPLSEYIRLNGFVSLDAWWLFRDISVFIVMEQEIWKDIKGFEGYYQVSNMGNIKSVRRLIQCGNGSRETMKNHTFGGKLLKMTINKYGFVSVHLRKKGTSKTASVGRLVADAFVENPDKVPFVGYKNGVTTDNNAKNLYWHDKIKDDNYSEVPKDVMQNNTEEWRDVVDYEGLYQVSSFGQVRSIERTNAQNQTTYFKIKNIRKDKYGRLRTSLTKDGAKKTFPIHRLVAMAFVDGYFEGATVNHKDENPCNNYYKNLEWMTKGDNNRYGTKARRTGDKNGKPVEQLTLNGEHIAFFKSIKEAAIKTGCDKTCVSNVCRGKNKQSRGFLFKFV